MCKFLEDVNFFNLETSGNIIKDIIRIEDIEFYLQQNHFFI